MAVQDSLWDTVDNEKGGDSSEQLRHQSTQALAQVPAGSASADHGPGDVLHAAGPDSGDGDRPDSGLAGADGAAGRGVPGRGGPAGDGEDDGRDAGNPGDAPGRPGGHGENRSANGLTVFAPGSDDELAPSGVIARLEANLAAVRPRRVLQAEGGAATPAEQETLARWSGWGAVSAVFKEKPDESRSLTRGREQLRELLSDAEYAAA